MQSILSVSCQVKSGNIDQKRDYFIPVVVLATGCIEDTMEHYMENTLSTVTLYQM